MSQEKMGTDTGRPVFGGVAFNRIPGATYRLQFHADFTFRHARQIIGYLHGMGVTDIYASPLFQAIPGSTHGYDICNHEVIGKDLGGMEAFQALTTVLREHGMGLLLDVVPNHMGTHATNAWWWDVLKHGRGSRYARFFDIDWEARGESLAGKILLPILGSPLPEVIAAGELKLRREDGEWLMTYHDSQLPVALNTPVEVIQQNDVMGCEEAMRNALLAILEAQHYRLAYWRVGLREINYRRFFDVSSLVALRIEDEEVFHATHQKVFELIQSGQVTGLRIDHPDGLQDPGEYFQRLQDRFAEMTGDDHQLYVVAEKILAGPESLPADWPVAGTTGYDFLNQVNGLFVASQNEPAMTNIYREFAGVSEDFQQISYLSRRRVLDLSFVAELNALARAAHGLLNADRGLTLEDVRLAIRELIACFPTYRTYIRRSAGKLGSSDHSVISEALREALGKAGHLAEAIEFVASILTLQLEVPAERETEAREFVLRFQQLTGPSAAKGIEDTAFYNYHRLVSLNEVGGNPAQFGITVQDFHRANRRRAEHWPHSLNATTTHDTKRGEDARARINVLSEMPGAWHSAVFRWRDVNARYKTVVHGESAPDANDEYLFYQSLVGAWPVELLAAPSLVRPAHAPLDEVALSMFRVRIGEYMLKAIREAKRQTSWTDANAAYEQAMGEFVHRVLGAGNAEFLADFNEFIRSVAFFGAINSLSQMLLKLTSPGVPDIYQGSELLDLSLVDPDNRRAVDYEGRGRFLENFEHGAGHGSKDNFGGDDLLFGNVKMFLLWKTLQFRQARRELFDNGDYKILRTTGARSNHLCAFARTWRGEYLAVVCPRLSWLLNHGEITSPCGSKTWLHEELDLTERPARRLHSVLTSEDLAMEASGRLPIAEVLRTFPVALLATS